MGGGGRSPQLAILGNFQLKYVLKFQKYGNFKILFCLFGGNDIHAIDSPKKKLGELKHPQAPLTLRHCYIF